MGGLDSVVCYRLTVFGAVRFVSLSESGHSGGMGFDDTVNRFPGNIRGQITCATTPTTHELVFFRDFGVATVATYFAALALSGNLESAFRLFRAELTDVLGVRLCHGSGAESRSVFNTCGRTGLSSVSEWLFRCFLLSMVLGSMR